MPKRTIKIREIVQDIRSGLTYLDLLEKYRLSSRQFQKVFSKLLKRGALEPSQLVSSLPVVKMKDYQVNSNHNEDNRRLIRDKVDFPLPVCKKDDRFVTGTIRDISERGIQIQGIVVNEGDVKTFIIPEHEPFVIEPVEFDAICRWAKKLDNDQECIAGFEVLKFSQGSLVDILVLMRFVSGQLKTQDIGEG